MSCTHSRTVLVHNHSESKSYFLRMRCDRRDCPACRKLFGKAWLETFSVRAKAFTYIGTVAAECFPRCYKRLRASRAQFITLRYSDHFVVFTDSDCGLADFRRYDHRHAITRMETLVEDNKFLKITSSRGWKLLPTTAMGRKRDRNGTPTKTVLACDKDAVLWCATMAGAEVGRWGGKGDDECLTVTSNGWRPTDMAMFIRLVSEVQRQKGSITIFEEDSSEYTIYPLGIGRLPGSITSLLGQLRAPPLAMAA